MFQSLHDSDAIMKETPREAARAGAGLRAADAQRCGLSRSASPRTSTVLPRELRRPRGGRERAGLHAAPRTCRRTPRAGCGRISRRQRFRRCRALRASSASRPSAPSERAVMTACRPSGRSGSSSTRSRGRCAAGGAERGRALIVAVDGHARAEGRHLLGNRRRPPGEAAGPLAGGRASRRGRRSSSSVSRSLL